MTDAEIDKYIKEHTIHGQLETLREKVIELFKLIFECLTGDSR